MKTILWNKQEYTVYGWQQETQPWLVTSKDGKGKSELLYPGKASFSYPITLATGSSFTLTGSTESFVVASAKTNLHQAQKS